MGVLEASVCSSSPPRWPTISASLRCVSWPVSATLSLHVQNSATQGDPAIEDHDVQSNFADKLGRARPKNPRLGVGKSTLAEFTKNLEDKLQTYEEQNHATLLFSVEERRALNKVKPNLEILSSEKWPLFHTVAVAGDAFSVDRLLNLNVDVNALDKDGYSALQRAVLAKKEAVVNQLLRAKADISVCDKGGATLLHYSVQTGSMNLVRSFLTCGVNVNSADKYGWTPLHLAVLTGRADIVRLLLASGADKTLANKAGLTALDLCFSLGRAFNAIDTAKALKIFPKEKPTVV